MSPLPSDSPSRRGQTSPASKPSPRFPQGSPSQQSQSHVPSTSRPSRPQSVTLPARPDYSSQYYQPGQNPAQSAHQQSPTATTPHSEKQGHSSSFPLSSGGPASPSTYSNSFVFPIRSVFQGIGYGGATSDELDDFALNRVTSRSSESRNSNNGHFGGGPQRDIESDAGMQSIAQLLQHNQDAQAKGGDREVGTATFNGRNERSGSLHQHKPTASQSTVPPLSTPYTEYSGSFFGSDLSRRQSEEDRSGMKVKSPKTSDDRPTLAQASSSGTVIGERHDGITNPSAEASGSGLPQKNRAPVGQPQESPSEINYREYPSEQNNPGETSRFSSRPVKQNRQPSLKKPTPTKATKGALDGLVDHPRDSKSGSSVSNIEQDEDGVQSLINDFSGIVRLGGTDSLTSATRHGGTGTGESGTGTKSSANRSRGANENAGKFAQQQTQRGNTRDSVRAFVNQQAQTVNMLDPNAPTPTNEIPETSNSTKSSTQPEEEDDGISVGQSAPAEIQQWTQNSGDADENEPSDQVKFSCGQSTTTSDDPEPIVTIRFEHVATKDGHHVVMGREGKLRSCEEEPITTPGAVQGFGVLIVLEENDETGILTIRQVSENATEILGLSPRYLFKLDCFSKILTADQEDVLRDNLEYLPILGKNSVNEEDGGPSVFRLSGYGEPGSDDTEDDPEREGSTTSGGSTNGRRREWTCWVAAHRPKASSADDESNPSDVIILEFELERDEYNPLIQPFDLPPPSAGGSDTAGSGSGSATAISATEQDQGSAPSSFTTATSSTHRPMTDHRDSDQSTVMTLGDGSVNISDRQLSSKVPRGSRPMGLDGVDYEIPIERILESTTNHAKPLRALERMRRVNDQAGSGASASTGRKGRGGARRPRRAPLAGATGTMDIFAVLSQINDQLDAASDLESFLKITVGVIQDLCRFHRVLIYQFDESMNGQVVSELVEWGRTTDLFKGLMFPAADIPAQARELYKINKVRMLYDRSQTTARMVLRSKEDLDKPLDMTHCYLRAMSPIHIKYLANMGVRSSMSVSIMAFGQLWGLIACHSYGHHGMRVSFPVRQMMRILSDAISRNIERLSYAQRLHTRKLAHPTGYIVSNADDLLQIFDAESGLLVIGEGCKLLGQNDQGHAMLAIAEYLRITKFDTIKASSHLRHDFPDLILPRANDTIAGLLYVPLTAKAGQDFIVFLRKGQVREVQWAGKPYKDAATGDAASLEPRKSFNSWSEIVTGRSRAWEDDQLESAGVLALIYGKFIQVWREKQSAMASNQLTAILLSNTSHAVRTPLSQIINTLELALAGDIDTEVRKNLENSHQASRALLFHVHDLLDLTRIETGNETAFNDPFDIRQTVTDAVRLYQTESTRRGLDFRVVLADNLPEFVIGDSRKIKTVISNIVANSVKFTEKGFIEVYCGVQHLPPSSGSVQSFDPSASNRVPIEFVISDSGRGIPTDRLEAMFVILEGADEGRLDNTGLGLGLAVVARIVEQLEGQLRAESEVGVGSRFYLTLPMLVHHGRTASRSSKGSKGDPTGTPAPIRGRTSSGSGSAVSLRSGMSEVDSFVNDFGGSHMLQSVSANDPRLREAEDRMSRPGTFAVTDSSYPIRPTRVDPTSDQSSSESPSPNLPQSPEQDQRPHFGERRISHQSRKQITSPPSSPNPNIANKAQTTFSQNRKPKKPLPNHEMRQKHFSDGKSHLRVLVVEDDLINSQILQKRLKMDKHTVKAVPNGQEAVTALQEDWDYDVVLMDIQMPIMDGRQAAKEIRILESTLEPQKHIDPLRVDDRIPIFAVSASLYESDRSNLAQDFDGWMLKPIDFARVRVLLAALEDPVKRSREVYAQGKWEKGGFLRDGSSPRSSPDSVK